MSTDLITALTNVAAALTGPFGSMSMALVVGYAVITGKLRLEREVTSERTRADKWEGLALDMLLPLVTRATAVATKVVETKTRQGGGA